MDKFFAMLVATGILLPSLATVATVLFYASGVAGSARNALLWGLEIPVLICMAAALVARGRATAEHAVPSSYAELRQRSARLRAELQRVAEKQDLDDSKAFSEDLIKNAAFNEANEHRKCIEEELGSSGILWLSTRGYINAWDRLHRAEEALIDITPKEAAVGGAVYDQLRLQNSQIQNSVGLNNMLVEAVKSLQPDADGSDPAAAEAKAAPSPKKPEAAGGNQSAESAYSRETEARAKLREVRCSINEYRGERWNGLTVARNRLLGTLFITGLVMYMILAVVLFLVGSININEIVVASVVFLIGAAMGLLNRLRADSQSDAAVADYGLSAARLVTTPLLSGVTAVFGVVLFAIAPLKGQSTATLQNIFTLEKDLSVLATAAVFGFAPGLLFDRLQSSVDKYKSELKSSQAAEGS